MTFNYIIKTGHNSTCPKGGVSSPLDSFVVAESSVLRINISGKNPAHRKSSKRYIQYYFKQHSLIIVNL
jgi:hypothetical protein